MGTASLRHRVRPSASTTSAGCTSSVAASGETVRRLFAGIVWPPNRATKKRAKDVTTFDEQVMGAVPAVLRHDNLSAATHELRRSGGRQLTVQFREVRTTTGCARRGSSRESRTRTASRSSRTSGRRRPSSRRGCCRAIGTSPTRRRTCGSPGGRRRDAKCAGGAAPEERPYLRPLPAYDAASKPQRATRGARSGSGRHPGGRQWRARGRKDRATCRSPSAVARAEPDPTRRCGTGATEPMQGSCGRPRAVISGAASSKAGRKLVDCP